MLVYVELFVVELKASLSSLILARLAWCTLSISRGLDDGGKILSTDPGLIRLELFLGLSVVDPTSLSSTEAGCVSFSIVVPGPSSQEGCLYCGVVTGIVCNMEMKRSAVVTNESALSSGLSEEQSLA